MQYLAIPGSSFNVPGHSATQFEHGITNSPWSRIEIDKGVFVMRCNLVRLNRSGIGFQQLQKVCLLQLNCDAEINAEYEGQLIWNWMKID
jgi:hypothetical protein